MYIATKLLIATLTTTPATDRVRDLCDVVHRETGTPTICKPHKKGAPVYDRNVCCSGSTCFPAVRSRCPSGQALYYCRLGQQQSTGEVACYFEVPDYCGVFVCPPAVAPPPYEGTLCCSQDICWDYNINTNDCEIGDIYWCGDGVTNPDGTVTCLDDTQG